MSSPILQSPTETALISHLVEMLVPVGLLLNRISLTLAIHLMYKSLNQLKSFQCVKTLLELPNHTAYGWYITLHIDNNWGPFKAEAAIIVYC